eukprot:m.91352 g.91352  ORF g.91352 m.91352 type:complete len:593 (-) comp26458_c0_seq2:164-1942(-)
MSATPSPAESEIFSPQPPMKRGTNYATTPGSQTSQTSSIDTSLKYKSDLAEMQENPKDFFSIENGKVPLIVFCNPKSGGQSGSKLMEEFQKVIDPSQVFNLMETENGKVVGATKGLKKFGQTKNLVIVVCGGDGTVGWVLSTMGDLHLTQNLIPVCVFPLGTGNDLARSLIYGSKYEGTKVTTLLKWLFDSATIYLDRWKIKIEPLDQEPNQPALVNYGDHQPTLEPPQEIWNNYLSFGSCAHITLDFHLHRENNPDAHNSRWKNQVSFFKFGTQEIVTPKFKSLSQNLELVCDGVDYTKEIRQKKIVSLAFINIQYFMAGAQPWGTVGEVNGFDAPSMADGRVEVIGYTGRLGLPMAQVKFLPKMVSAWRITQCKTATVKCLTALPAQLDGEPFLPAPSIITLTCKDQAVMVCRRKYQFSHLPRMLMERLPVGSAFRSSRGASRRQHHLHVDPATATVLAVHLVHLNHTDIVASSAYSSVGSISFAGETKLSEIRKMIQYNTGANLPEMWSFLRFDNEGSRYMFITDFEETKRSTKEFAEPIDGARRGLFVTSTYRLVEKVRKTSSLTSKAPLTAAHLARAKQRQRLLSEI